MSFIIQSTAYDKCLELAQEWLAAQAAGGVVRYDAATGKYTFPEEQAFANDKVEDNLNPLGRVFYSVSTMVCVPASLNENGPALGAQAGEARTKEIVMSAGFSNFRRATQTPFNLVYEARP